MVLTGWLARGPISGHFSARAGYVRLVSTFGYLCTARVNKNLTFLYSSSIVKDTNSEQTTPFETAIAAMVLRFQLRRQSSREAVQQSCPTRESAELLTRAETITGSTPRILKKCEVRSRRGHAERMQISPFLNPFLKRSRLAQCLAATTSN